MLYFIFTMDYLIYILKCEVDSRHYFEELIAASSGFDGTEVKRLRKEYNRKNYSPTTVAFMGNLMKIGAIFGVNNLMLMPIKNV